MMSFIPSSNLIIFAVLFILLFFLIRKIVRYWTGLKKTLERIEVHLIEIKENQKNNGS